MKKLLHIKPVLRTSTSTGRIIQEIGAVAMAAGWDNYIAIVRDVMGSDHLNLNFCQWGLNLVLICMALLQDFSICMVLDQSWLRKGL